MTTPYDLTGRVAFITGATSGLGRHFAKVLSAAGAVVALAGRRIDRLDEVKAEIEAAGGKAAAAPLDVTDAGAIGPAFDKVQADLGVADILINNAGLSRFGLSLELTANDFDTVIATNLRAPFLLATEFARRVIPAKKEARIVNIASIGAFKVLPGVTPYCTSKAGLAMLTQCLAREWANKGINVNALCPGYVETELNDDWFKSDKGQKQIAGFPRKRLAKESDLDGMLLLLCSDAARTITGSLLTVDDGQSL
ncbi:MAG: SDR family NAD(P)-dependent oxidoreductase [Alphaproteobacteria bacterium]|nr:SDR family NAD(P)-dependent oxidoreductase [Alphaproteobacteria bacterium]MBL6939587.1 SDR family NAD(P)-dependent oxidoreductase [Alphaproteobacteria bacterium]MBL7100040.1 SDR family NAD(P)-dependent oxidoreductase [Alphaproteobacteria bacterium]